MNAQIMTFTHGTHGSARAFAIQNARSRRGHTYAATQAVGRRGCDHSLPQRGSARQLALWLHPLISPGLSYWTTSQVVELQDVAHPRYSSRRLPNSKGLYKYKSVAVPTNKYDKTTNTMTKNTSSKTRVAENDAQSRKQQS